MLWQSVITAISSNGKSSNHIQISSMQAREGLKQWADVKQVLFSCFDAMAMQLGRNLR